FNSLGVDYLLGLPRRRRRIPHTLSGCDESRNQIPACHEITLCSYAGRRRGFGNRDLVRSAARPKRWLERGITNRWTRAAGARGEGKRKKVKAKRNRAAASTQPLLV